MKKEQSNIFHINQPYFGAWVKYGWEKDDWGIGLSKPRVDKIAKKDGILIVSYYKSDQQYTIKAKEAQTFPKEEIKQTGLLVYIVPKSKLHYKKPQTDEERLEELKKLGVFY